MAGGYLALALISVLSRDVRSPRPKRTLREGRAGIIKEFTGISDPYEQPDDADVVMDTTDVSPSKAAHQILLYVEKEGYIGAAHT